MSDVQGAWAAYCAHDKTDTEKRDFLKIWSKLTEKEQAAWIQKKIAIRKVRKGGLYNVGAKRIRIVGFEPGSGLSTEQPIVTLRRDL